MNISCILCERGRYVRRRGHCRLATDGNGGAVSFLMHGEIGPKLAELHI
jgi:hypothetical protein